jgi:hypothetical protein
MGDSPLSFGEFYIFCLPEHFGNKAIYPPKQWLCRSTQAVEKCRNSYWCTRIIVVESRR